MRIKNFKIILSLALLAKKTLQGKWMIAEQGNTLELSEGEKFKVNFNTSLDSFSRAEMEEGNIIGNASFSFSNTTGLDWIYKPQDGQFSYCQNFTKINEKDFAFYCEKQKEKYLVKFSSKMRKIFKIKKSFIRTNDTEVCSDIISVRMQSFAVVCRNEKYRYLRFVALEPQEELNGRKSGPGSLIIVGDIKVKIENSEIDLQNLQFATSKNGLAKRRISPISKNLHVFSLMSKKIENSSNLNWTIWIATLKYSQSNPLTDPWYNKVKYYSKDNLKNFEKNFEIGKIKSDGITIYIPGFRITDVDRIQKIKIDLHRIKMVRKNHSMTFLEPILGIGEIQKGDSFLHDILNEEDAVLYQKYLRKSAKNPLEINPDDHLLIATSNQNLTNLALIVVKKEDGVIMDAKLMRSLKKEKILEKVEKVEGLRLSEGRILFNGRSKNGSLVYFRWDFTIEKDLDTYPVIEEFPIPVENAGVFLTEEITSIFNFTYQVKYLLKNDLILMNELGEVAQRTYQRPFFSYRYDRSSVNKEPKKFYQEITINGYNEDKDKWERKNFRLNVTKIGGVIELEKEVGIFLDLYSKRHLVAHLPLINKGVSSLIHTTFNKNIKNLEITQMKVGELSLNPGYFSRFKDIVIYSSNMIVGVVAESNKLQILRYSFWGKSNGNIKFEEVEEIEYSRSFRVIHSQYYTSPMEGITLTVRMRETKEICLLNIYKRINMSYQMFERCFDREESFSDNVDPSVSWIISVDKPLPYTIKRLSFGIVRVMGMFDVTPFTKEDILLDRYLFDNYKIEANITKVFAIIPLESKYNNELLVILAAPLITIMKINFDQNQNSEQKLIYVSEMEFDLERTQVNLDMANGWLHVLQPTLKISREGEIYNILTSKINVTKAEDSSYKVESIDQMQILSDYNSVYFNGAFKEIKQIKISCEYRKERGCVGFFIGNTGVEDGINQYSIAALNLNPEMEASNRLIALERISQYYLMKEISYDYDKQMFLVHLQSSRSSLSKIFYILENQTPFLTFDFTKIETGTSEGKVTLTNEFTNIVGNENLKMNESTLQIHKVETPIHYSTGQRRIKLQSVREKSLNLDQVLNLRGWVTGVNFQKRKGGIIQRLEEIKKQRLEECIEHRFRNKTFGFDLKILMAENAVYVTEVGSSINNHWVVRVKENSSSSNPEEYCVYDEINFMLVNQFDPVVYQLEGSEYHGFLSLSLDFADKRLRRVFLHNVFHDKKEDKFRLISTTVPIFGLYSSEALISFSQIKFKDKDHFVFFVRDKILNERGSLTAIAFTLDTDSNRVVNLKIHSFENSKNDPNKILNGEIDQMEVTSEGRNLVLVSRMKYKDKLFMNYMRLEELKNGEMNLVSYSLECFYLYRNDENAFAISETGFESTKIKLIPRITNSQITVVMASTLYQGYFFNIELNNFIKVKSGDQKLLKKQVRVVHKLQNIYMNESIQIEDIQIVENHIKIQIGSKKSSENYSAFFIYEIPKKSKHKKVTNSNFPIIPKVSRVYNQAYLFTNLELPGPESKVELIVLTSKTQESFPYINLDPVKRYRINSNFKLAIQKSQTYLSSIISDSFVVKGLDESQAVKIESTKVFTTEQKSRVPIYVITGVLISVFVILIFVFKNKQPNKGNSDNLDCSINMDKSLDSRENYKSVRSSTQNSLLNL